MFGSSVIADMLGRVVGLRVGVMTCDSLPYTFLASGKFATFKPKNMIEVSHIHCKIQGPLKTFSFLDWYDY